ncbi:expressed unknown protein [Seminavis robusta]|uniref:RNI-like protein n=1 Tax=Seminavis robusta TaxID=568900 RepID=A0A9N8F3K6_9STRA|nr:expressed unknown protein [Seminavis robusta]|eukprot:Sro3007_g342000.1 n/a (456) ;mRNA; r:6592-7959
MYLEITDEEDVVDAIVQINSKCDEGNDGSSCCAVNHLQIQLESPLQHLPPASLRRFFQVVRTKLPDTPVELHIASSSSLDASVNPPLGSSSRPNTTSTEALSLILRLVPNLHLLELCEVTLDGGPDLEGFKQSIVAQQGLTHVYLRNVQHANNNIDLRPLAEALSELPKLKALELYQVQFFSDSAFNAQALALIAQSCHATRLEIMPCERHNIQEQGLAIGEGLLQNTRERLQELALLTKISPKQSVMYEDAVIASLARFVLASSNLQRLQLNVCETINLVPLADALMHNTSLTTLAICWDRCAVTSQRLQYPWKHRFTQTARQRNQSLRRNIQAWRRVLKDHNFGLERLDITMKDCHGVFGQEWKDSEIEFWLQLNRLGRQTVLREQSKANDWISTLSKCKDDTSSLFYFLSEQPRLCFESTTVSTRVNSSRRPRTEMKQSNFSGPKGKRQRIR